MITQPGRYCSTEKPKTPRYVVLELRVKAQDAEEQAESLLRRWMHVSQVAFGKAWLGNLTLSLTLRHLSTCPNLTSRGSARRQLVQQEVRAGLKEERTPEH